MATFIEVLYISCRERIQILNLTCVGLISAMSNSCYFYLERSARVLVPPAIFKVFGILARDITFATLCKTSSARL